MCPDDLTVTQTIDILLRKTELIPELIELRKITDKLKEADRIQLIDTKRKLEADTEYRDARDAWTKSMNNYNELLHQQADVFMTTMQRMYTDVEKTRNEA